MLVFIKIVLSRTHMKLGMTLAVAWAIGLAHCRVVCAAEDDPTPSVLPLQVQLLPTFDGSGKPTWVKQILIVQKEFDKRLAQKIDAAEDGRLRRALKDCESWNRSAKWSREHLPAEQDDLKRIRKDEFETAKDFEKRREALAKSIESSKRIIADYEKQIAEVDERVAVVAREVRVPLEITLAASPQFDADKMSFSITLDLSREYRVLSGGFSNSFAASIVNQTEDVLSVSVATVSVDAPKGMLEVIDVPSIDVAKQLKSNLMTDGVMLKGDAYITSHKESSSKGAVEASYSAVGKSNWSIVKIVLADDFSVSHPTENLPTGIKLNSKITASK